MKSINTSSMFTSNNSIPLIIFVFIFIGVGMFFLIQKTTEKEKTKQARINSTANNNSPSGGDLEQKIIIESRNVPNQINVNDSLNTQDSSIFIDNMSTPFSDEVGLFIQRNDNNNGYGNTSGSKININKYSTPQPYIPPFGTGKETRCMDRQIKRPNTTNTVLSTGNSDLVKTSSDASY
jgi:hypothetical protein